jgi:hypothetical protein
MSLLTSVAPVELNLRPSAQKVNPTRPPISVASSPPPSIFGDSPTPLPKGESSTSKRKYQSRIDELFLPQMTSGSNRKRPLSVNSDDSEQLDHIQLELENPFETQIDNEESGADSDVIIGPRARRRRYLPSSPPNVGRPHTPSPAAESSDDELSQELRDIASSARKVVVKNRTRDSQSRNKRKSQFQKNLESLRKRKDATDDESDDESVKPKALYDSESDVDSIGSDDFVVEDDEKLTAEQMMEIPPEFTSVSYQGPQHNFKVVVQAEVFALLHPDYHALDYSSMSSEF